MKIAGYSAIALAALAIFAARADAAPISIGDYNELKKIGADADFPLDGDYELTADIDASASVWYDGGFTPIGRRVVIGSNGLGEINDILDTDRAFTGTFDGKGFAISGLIIDRVESSGNGANIGLFGYAHNAIIKNVTVIADTVAGNRYVGALVGRVFGGRIAGCRAFGVVRGSSEVGGLAGMIEGGAAVFESYAAASVSGRSSVGGFVGHFDGSTILSGYSVSAVSGELDRIGGFVGNVSSVGGITRITHSYAAGVVAPGASLDAGGFAGTHGGGIFTACFWDTQRSGMSASAGGNGRTTAQMASQSTFTWGFHADSAWGISNNYPYLRIFPSHTLTYRASSGGGTVAGEAVHIQIVNDGVDGMGVRAELTEIGEGFDGWRVVSGADSAVTRMSTDSMTITHAGVVGDVEAEARFTVKTYTVTYAANPAGGGFFAEGAADPVADTLKIEVEHGAAGPRVTAVPGTGFVFSRWHHPSFPSFIWDTVATRAADTITSDTVFVARFSTGTITLTYSGGEDGDYVRINNSGGSMPSHTARVSFGADGPIVEARAHPNRSADYRFVKWSDGVTDNPRTDLQVRDDIDVYAIFAINAAAFTYIAGPGGKVLAETPGGGIGMPADTAIVNVDYFTRGPKVAAVPDDEYVFVGWSDGAADSVRTDSTGRTPLAVTALFEPVVSVMSGGRTISSDGLNNETAAVLPAMPPANKFTAGPNPAAKGSAAVNFYWEGRAVRAGTLSIFDVSGNLVTRIAVNGGDRRVASWDLTGRNGRRAAAGTYLVRGTFAAVDGKRETVSIIVGVNR